MKREPVTCGNCNAQTDNEPFALCVDCSDEERIGERRRVDESKKLLQRAAKAEAQLILMTAYAREAVTLAMREQCGHEETRRGGAIWTICTTCGAKWADDRGGFKPNQSIARLDELSERIDGIAPPLKKERRPRASR